MCGTLYPHPPNQPDSEKIETQPQKPGKLKPITSNTNSQKTITIHLTKTQIKPQNNQN